MVVLLDPGYEIFLFAVNKLRVPGFMTHFAGISRSIFLGKNLQINLRLMHLSKERIREIRPNPRNP